jgi:5-methylcytosine-specific restriction enzyme subunit McrC
MPRILQVVEYQKLSIGDVQGGTVFEQRHFDRLARYHDEQAGHLYFDLRRTAVVFGHHVGVIQVGDITIEILPKVDDVESAGEKTLGKWHDILLRMLREAGMIPVDTLSNALLREKSNSLLDVYLHLFLNEVEALLHRGLVKRYRQVEGQQQALRGALQFGQHIARNLVHQERFYTRHQTYDYQHRHNQLVRQALVLIPRLTSSPTLRGRTARALLQWAETPAIKVTASTFSRLTYSRKTEAYRPALRIARLLLLNHSPDLRGGGEDLIALLFNMNRLWEQYLLRTLKRLYEPLGWEVTKPRSKTFWKGTNTKSSMEPDILIKVSGKGIIVLDAKWKRPNGRPAGADLRQLYAYAQYYGATHTLLCYPHSHAEVATEGIFMLPYLAPGAADQIIITCGTVFVRVGGAGLHPDETGLDDQGYLKCSPIPQLLSWLPEQAEKHS